MHLDTSAGNRKGGRVEFTPELRDRITENLARHPVREHRLEGRRHAAVAVVLLDSDDELHGRDDLVVDRLLDVGDVPGSDAEEFTGRVDGTAGGAALLLTRRGAHLSAHARQWAFPGGRVDKGETPLEAALREMHEEVGLQLDSGHLIGRLDDYPTRSGYVMSPFVFWIGDDHEPVANPDEVASVHRVGIDELQRPDSPRFVEIPESERPVVQMPIGGDLIHAPTGAILYQFRAVCLEGRSLRVDDLEQPVFAWK